jgi:hypothetical protein
MELSEREATLLRICFHTRLKDIESMRQRRKWTREEMQLAVSEVKALALKFGMRM